MKPAQLLPLIAMALLWNSCAPTPGSVKDQPPAARTKEEFFRSGRRLHLTQQFDSALAMHGRAVALDSAYIDPWKEMADILYTQYLLENGEANPHKREKSRAARSSYMRVERLGFNDADVYERICELSLFLGDDRTYLTYAKKNAEQYPFDRQYFNLGLAYFNAGQYQDVIRTQKEATEKFPSSPFIGGFYRQLGRAYENIDRDQTAERTFVAGVKALDEALSRLARAGKAATEAEYTRYRDDRIGMLLALKKLHQRYRDDAKLKDVERQLKEAGYAK